VSLNKGTGSKYPTVTLGGVTYPVKVTREILLYRMIQKGIDFSNKNNRPKALEMICETIHFLIADHFHGTVEDLAQLIIQENKIIECGAAIKQLLETETVPPAQITTVPARYVM
jgi:hypothetical protein